MDARKEHTVVIGGVSHTVLLDGDDAERLKAQIEAESKAETPSNKARNVKNK